MGFDLSNHVRGEVAVVQVGVIESLAQGVLDFQGSPCAIHADKRRMEQDREASAVNVCALFRCGGEETDPTVPPDPIFETAHPVVVESTDHRHERLLLRDESPLQIE